MKTTDDKIKELMETEGFNDEFLLTVDGDGVPEDKLDEMMGLRASNEELLTRVGNLEQVVEELCLTINNLMLSVSLFFKATDRSVVSLKKEVSNDDKQNDKQKLIKERLMRNAGLTKDGILETL